MLYGSDAFGGVINIKTKKPEKRETDIIASYGTYDTQVYRFRHGDCRSRFDYYFTGNWRMTDGHLPNSAYDGKDFTVRMGYEIGEGIEATLTGRYFDGYKEEPLRATDEPRRVSDIWNDYEMKGAQLI